ncbi:hypothetical protein KZC51_03865 [Microbacterium sp. SSW1-49]|uniref:Uncharacterized protein n=1 Tax=Microbacterium croceum TaxID=2851645 RepID=A0ABT0FC46_9MICO|nr:hypothetical protein [Microbacterium croceum]MCK2035264.1 hypothetical protein [Microbacterium croceum]
MNSQIDIAGGQHYPSSGVRKRAALIATATVFAMVFAGTVPANAASDSDPDAVAEAVAEAAPTDLEALPVEQFGDLLTASLDDGGTVATGVDAADGLTFSSADGSQVANVALPGGTELSQASVSEDGSITFAGDRSVPSVNVLASANAVRVATVIASAEQTEEFAYDFGHEATVEIREDGGALVVIPGADGTEVIIADIDTPWATDASGAPVSTHYVAESGVLTQVVSHRAEGVTYPVVADPKFDSPNALQVRVRFTRAETGTIAAGGWGGAIGSFSCGAMMAVCALASGVLVYQAGVAQRSKPKRCVQVTATSPIVIPGLVWWVDTYSGGACR